MNEKTEKFHFEERDWELIITVQKGGNHWVGSSFEVGVENQKRE